MKIHRAGSIPMPPPLWPLGYGFQCHECACRFVIEVGDSFVRVTETGVGGRCTMTLPCPECGLSLTATRPKTSQVPQPAEDARP